MNQTSNRDRLPVSARNFLAELSKMTPQQAFVNFRVDGRTFGWDAQTQRFVRAAVNNHAANEARIWEDVL